MRTAHLVLADPPLDADNVRSKATQMRENGLLPVSQTPSLGVMMKPEVVHGSKKNIQPRVQA